MDPKKALRMINDPVKARKAQQMKKKSYKEEVKAKEWKVLEKVELDVSDIFKQNYTPEENYRAYKLFSIMDVDNGGSISLRELKRCVMGDISDTLAITFDHPDCGIVWGIDEDNCIIVEKVEENSPASLINFLVPRLRLVKFNGKNVPPHDKSFLQYIYKELFKLIDEPIMLEFKEPVLIFNKFSHSIDVEVGGRQFSILLPVGAVYNAEVFEAKAKEAFIKAHPSFQFLDMKINIDKRQVTLHSDKFPFRLLFRTGATSHISCRYAIGFAAEDTTLHHKHKGTAMLIDLNLNIKEEHLDYLINELFATFDRDGSGEFEFEEFRDFYIKYLDTEEAMDLLRRYAAYKFRDQDKERAYFEMIEAKRIRDERRKANFTKNRSTKKAQQERDLSNSWVGDDGLRRRLYDYRRIDRLMTRKPRKAYMKSIPFNGRRTLKADEERAYLKSLKESNKEVNFFSTGGEITGRSNRSDISLETLEEGHVTFHSSKAKDIGVYDVEFQKDKPLGISLMEKEYLLESKYLLKCIEVTALASLSEAEVDPSKSSATTLSLLHLLVHTGDILLMINEHVVLDKTIIEVLEINKMVNEVSQTRIFKFLKPNKVNVEKLFESLQKGVTVATYMDSLIRQKAKLRDFETDSVSKLESATLPSARSEKSDISLETVEDDDAIIHAGKSKDLGFYEITFRNEKPIGISLMEKEFTLADGKKATCAAVSVVGESEGEINAEQFSRATISTLHMLVSVGDILLTINDELVIDETIDVILDFAQSLKHTADARTFRFIKPSKINIENLITSIRNGISLDTYMDELKTQAMKAKKKKLKESKKEVKEKEKIGGLDEEEFKKLSLREQVRLKKLAQKRENKLQAEHRKKMMAMAIADNDKLNRENRRNLVRNAEEAKLIALREVHAALRDGISKAISIVDDQNVRNLQKFNINLKSVIGTPAIKISEAVFGKDIGIDDIDLVHMPSTHLNPVVTSYFLLREPREDNYIVRESTKKNPLYDQSIKHPVFFTADFTRETSRNAKYARASMEIIKRTCQDGVDFRRARGIKLCTDVPREDIIPQKYQPSVKFVPPPKEKPHRLVARCTVISIILSELPKVHMFDKNSPFVTVQCGENRWDKWDGFKASTEVIAFAGSSAEWGDLGWTFRMYADETFKIEVSSGSPASNKFIGRYFITNTDFVRQPISKRGEMNLHATLLDKDNIFAGNLNMELFVEKGSEYDWYVFNYQREVIRKRKISKLRRRLLKKSGAPPPREVFWPLKMEILSIRVFDLIDCHLLVKNSPYVTVDCGQFSALTEVHEKAGSFTEWNDLGLDWIFHLHSEKSNVIFMAYSGEKIIGRFNINGKAISEAPRTRSGNITILGVISTPTAETGKIVIKAKLDAEAFHPDASYVLSSLQSTHDVGSVADIKPEQSNSMLSFQDTLTIDEFTTTGILPARVSLLGVAILDLNPTPASTCYLKLKCGVWEKQTETVSISHHSSIWENMTMEFPITERLSFEVEVYTGTVGIMGTSFKLLGRFAIGAVELANTIKDKLGQTEVIQTVVDGAIVVGSIKVLLTIVPEREGSLAKFFPDEMRGLSEPSITSPIKGYGSVIFSVNSATKSQYESRPGRLLYLPKSSIGDVPISLPFRMTITSITVVELESVHYLNKNSPHVNVAMGDWACMTPPVMNAGTSATWEALTWSVFVHEKENLRITTWSGDTLIGSTTISAESLLETGADDLGISTIFQPLLNNGRDYGKVKLIFTKETLDPDDAEDPFAYKTEDIKLKAPILATVYTISVMDLRSVHPFSRNYPFMRVTCGKFKGSTPIFEQGGSNAKWEEIMWPLPLRKGTESKISVLSGSVVIGFIMITAEDLCALPIDKYGLTTFEGFLTDGKDMASTGKIRILCRLEGHTDDDDDDTDSDEDIAFEFDGKYSLLGLPKNYIPKMTQVYVLAISIQNLEYKKTLWHNSPFVSIVCDKYGAKTNPQFITGDSCKWVDLSWSFQLRRRQLIRINVTAGQTLIGTANLTNRDLFDVDKDDSGHSLVMKSLNKDGFFVGNVQIQFRLESFNDFEVDNEEEEIDESLFFYDPLSIPYDPWLPIQLPFSIRVVKIAVIDLIPLHIVGANSPFVQITSGEDKKKTKPWYRAGSSALWKDMEWKFVVKDPNHVFNISVSSGIFPNRASGGSLSLNVMELLSIPRTKEGLTVISGSLLQKNFSYGRVQVVTILAPYVSEEEHERLKIEEEERLKELNRKPNLLGFINIVSIHAEDMTQVYDLFPNCPRAIMKFGPWENTTVVLDLAGEEAIWGDLGWVNIPIVEKSELYAMVISGNEPIGIMSMKSEDIMNLNPDQFGYITISSDLVDGNVYKGKISINAQIQKIDREARKIDKNVEFKGSLLEYSVVDDDSLFESFMHRNGLSMSTPTPLMTKTIILDVTVFDLKSVHTSTYNSPQVLFECGTWKQRTKALNFAGKSANWNNVGFSFIMKNMTYLKISVLSRGIIIGTCKISTRELLEVPKDSSNHVILTRTIEDEIEISGKIRLGLKVEAAGLVEREQSTISIGSFSKTSIATPLQLSVPFTVKISKIFVIDLIPLHNLVANSPYVQIIHQDWKKKTDIRNRAGANTKWENLGWVCNVFESKAAFDIVVYSGSVKAGVISITIPQLLQIPMSSEGEIEISELIEKDKTLRGRVKIFAYLLPFMTDEQKQLEGLIDNVNPVDYEATDICRLSVLLVTATEIPRPVTHAHVILTVNDWKNKSQEQYNRSGIVAWGNLDWNELPLKEKSVVTIQLMTGREQLGVFSMSAIDILALPMDKDHCITISGDICNNNKVFKGRISMSCKLDFPSSFSQLISQTGSQLSPFQMNPSWISSMDMTETSMPSGLIIPHETQVTIVSVSAKKLRSAHTSGKNNPYLRMESGTTKYRTKAIPNGGNEGHYDNLLWNFVVRERTPIRITIQSGTSTVGTAVITTKELWIAENNKFNNVNVNDEDYQPVDEITYIEKDLYIQTVTDPCMGVVEILFKVEKLSSTSNIERSRTLADVPEDDMMDDVTDDFNGDLDNRHNISNYDVPYLQLGGDMDFSQSVMSGITASSRDAELVASRIKSLGIYEIEFQKHESMGISLMERELSLQDGEIIRCVMVTGVGQMDVEMEGDAMTKVKELVNVGDIVLSINSHIVLDKTITEVLHIAQQVSDERDTRNFQFFKPGKINIDQLILCLDNGMSIEEFSFTLLEEVDRNKQLEKQHSIIHNQSIATSISAINPQGKWGIYDIELDAEKPFGISLIEKELPVPDGDRITCTMVISISKEEGEGIESNTNHVLQQVVNVGDILLAVNEEIVIDKSITEVKNVIQHASEGREKKSFKLVKPGKLNIEQLASCLKNGMSVAEFLDILMAQQHHKQSLLQNSQTEILRPSTSRSEDSRPKSSRGGDITGRSWISDSSYGSYDSGYSSPSTERSDRSGASGSSSDWRSPRSDRSGYTTPRSGYSSALSTARSSDDEYSSAPSTARSFASAYSSASSRSNRSFRSGYSDTDTDEEGWKPERAQISSYDKSQARRWMSATRDNASSPASRKKSLKKSGTPIPREVFKTNPQVLALVTDGDWVFDMKSLIFVHNKTPKSDIIKIVAHKQVEDLIEHVLLSFQAEAMGQDYDGPATSIFTIMATTTPPLASTYNNNTPIDAIRKDVVLAITKQIVLIGATNVLRSTLKKFDEDELSVKSKGSQVQPERFTRRKGITYAKGNDEPVFFSPNVINLEVEEGFDLHKGSIPGLPKVPMKGRVTILDIMGFDISHIDRRVLPKRPYLTACKPYGNWGEATKPMWTTDRVLKKKEMVLEWRNLPETEGWQPAVIRIGHSIIFDIHDGGSGLIFAKMSLPWELMALQAPDDEGVISIFSQFEIANQYGGGTTSGVIRLSVDLSVNVWLRPPKTPEYFEEKVQSQHWRVYAITPLCTGFIRKKYGTLGKDYDKQKLIHPSLFGFNIRWRSAQQDESRFIHPIFQGYTLARKPLEKHKAEELARIYQVQGGSNPYKWDPTAHTMGKCPVCGDGIAGCPRCFMMPRRKKDGSSTVPQNFQYDQEKEKRDFAAEEIEAQKKAEKAALIEKKRKQMIASGRFELLSALPEADTASVKLKEKDEISVAPTISIKSQEYADASEVSGYEEEEEKIEFHTKLTTYLGLENYRKHVQDLLTVYVKVMPGGYIRRLIVDPTTSVAQFYAYFNSHADIGSAIDQKIVVPSKRGFFEMCNGVTVADEFTIADNTGREKLLRYGIKQRGANIVILYFRKYNRDYVPSLLKSWFEKNTLYRIERLPVYSTLEYVPDDLKNDEVQKHMIKVIIRQFKEQCYDEQEFYINRGVEHRNSGLVKMEEAMAKRRKEKLIIEREKKAMEKRMESQLAHFPEGPEREKMRIILWERELGKKHHIEGMNEEIAKERERYLQRQSKLLAKRQGIVPGSPQADSLKGFIEKTEEDAAQLVKASALEASTIQGSIEDMEDVFEDLESDSDGSYTEDEYHSSDDDQSETGSESDIGSESVDEDDDVSDADSDVSKISEARASVHALDNDQFDRQSNGSRSARSDNSRRSKLSEKLQLPIRSSEVDIQEDEELTERTEYTYHEGGRSRLNSARSAYSEESYYSAQSSARSDYSDYSTDSRGSTPRSEYSSRSGRSAYSESTRSDYTSSTIYSARSDYSYEETPRTRASTRSDTRYSSSEPSSARTIEILSDDDDDRSYESSRLRSATPRSTRPITADTDYSYDRPPTPYSRPTSAGSNYSYDDRPNTRETDYTRETDASYDDRPITRQTDASYDDRPLTRETDASYDDRPITRETDDSFRPMTGETDNMSPRYSARSKRSEESKKPDTTRSRIDDIIQAQEAKFSKSTKSEGSEKNLSNENEGSVIDNNSFSSLGMMNRSLSSQDMNKSITSHDMNKSLSLASLGTGDTRTRAQKKRADLYGVAPELSVEKRQKYRPDSGYSTRSDYSRSDYSQSQNSARSDYSSVSSRTRYTSETESSYSRGGTPPYTNRSGASSYDSRTPRSRLPSGDDDEYERLPTDRSGFSDNSYYSRDSSRPNTGLSLSARLTGMVNIDEKNNPGKLTGGSNHSSIAGSLSTTHLDGSSTSISSRISQGLDKNEFDRKRKEQRMELLNNDDHSNNSSTRFPQIKR